MEFCPLRDSQEPNTDITEVEVAFDLYKHLEELVPKEYWMLVVSEFTRQVRLFIESTTTTKKAL